MSITGDRAERRPRRSCRPILEVLEDRLAPATFSVTTTADSLDANDGKLSLREAISLANATAESDTIALKKGYYRINIPEAGGNDNSTGDFDITNPVTIRGEGKNATYVSGEALHRVFDLIGDHATTFAKLSIINGNGGFGGGIQALTAGITLRKARVSGNTGFIGGGINAEEGDVTLIKSSVVSNRATGGAGAEGDGGGIRVGNGTVTLVDSTVSDNVAARNGGGISSQRRINTQKVFVYSSKVSANIASAGNGGGIDAYADVDVSLSTVSGNSAFLAGGGIHARVVVVGSSTVSGNDADSGGGINAEGTNLFASTVHGNNAVASGGGAYTIYAYLLNATVSGNNAGSDGGGINALGGGLRNATICNNTANNAGGGVFRRSSNVTALQVHNTIVARNFVGAIGFGLDVDVSGDFASQGHNLIGIGYGSTGFGAAGDLVGSFEKPRNPLFGPLQNNGGPTLTHALLRGSPAIDAGDNTDTLPADQRGVARPKDGNGDGSRLVDIGAFEK